MAIDIKFDLIGNPEPPTIILANRNGNKLGQLDIDEDSIELIDKLNDASEFTFTMHKKESISSKSIYNSDNSTLRSSDDYLLTDINDIHLLPLNANESFIQDGVFVGDLWDAVVNFKLVYCKEWDMWFEITVELDEETETVKTVFCKQLGQAELSQLMLYNIEINTEEDIKRDDYKIAILYDAFDHESSIIHRLLKDKAPHYSVIHVDSTIAKLQRMFSFDDISIYDAFQEIAEEIGCLFVFHSNSGENGKIQRTISIYDLESNCNDCGHRGEFTGYCPECGSYNIKEGYGDDTTIFVTADELGEDISLTTNTDAVKNCFKLEAGDDLMTATIRNCNPNGTDYLWHISNESKSDMSSDLVEKLDSYDESYRYYQKEYISRLDKDTLSKYNALVEKYKDSYDTDSRCSDCNHEGIFVNECPKCGNDNILSGKTLQSIPETIVGYPALMQAYYNTIDLELYLKSSMMPMVEINETNAQKEADKLISGNLSPVAAENIDYLSLATADNIVLAMAKIIVDSRYKVKILDSQFENGSLYKVWTGNFSVTSYSDEKDTAISTFASVFIEDDYEKFVQQKIDKALNKENTDEYSISGLFAKEQDEFEEELKKYSLNCLSSFHNACQSCIDILIEQGIGNKTTWSGQDPNLYDDLYVPYLDKLSAIEYEMNIRNDEINLITGIYDVKGDLQTYGLQTYIEEIQDFIHNELDFEKYLGTELWHEFCSYRREDKYSNENYISDGLNNAELFDNALKFIENAQKEIYKSSELQHSITSKLINLLAIDKFKPLVEKFEVGNWIRILIDEEIYKLRLIEYTIDYGDFNNIKVEFSDVVKLDTTINSIKGVIEQANKMATSYDSVQKQAEAGKNTSTIVGGWSIKGMDVTNTKIIQGANDQTQTWDEHGMLFRQYDEVTDSYSDTQLKIVNSTMAITDDNWKTVKTAVGKYYYFDPVTGELKEAYGINAEVLVGKLILGEQLGIYNETGSLTFDSNGFEITNGVNSFKVNPDADILLSISDGDKKVFYVSKEGGLYIDGSGVDISGNVVFTDFKEGLENGTTVISGGCIQTGTIAAEYIDATSLHVNAANIDGTLSANQINMSGAISWGDLDEDLQDTFSNIDMEWPDYITDTYIDGAEIRSPIIKGNSIYANDAFHISSGGQFGYATGLKVIDDDGTTEESYGVAMSADGDPIDYWTDGHYIIVTDGGCRMQAGENRITVTEKSINITTGYNPDTGERCHAYYNGNEIGSGTASGVVKAVWG